MIKNLITVAAAAAIALTAAADATESETVTVTTGYHIENLLSGDASNFNGGTTGGWGAWGKKKDDTATGLDETGGVDGSACMKLTPTESSNSYDAQFGYTFSEALTPGSYTIKFKAKTDAESGTLQFQYQNSSTYSSQGGYKTFNIGTDWTDCEYEFTLTYDDVNRIIINFGAVAGSYWIDDIEFNQKVEDSGDFTVKELNLTYNNKNLLLSEYEGYDDSYELDIILTITKAADSSVAAGWGVGDIYLISQSSKSAEPYNESLYQFIAKEVSEEGALNTYKFTVGQFKEFAMVDGSYFVDDYNQSGVTFNVYNGAVVTAARVLVPVDTDSENGEDGGDQTSVSTISVDSNAPVEYFNLQGVRVANPQNGLFIRRQGNVATKVLVK